MEKMRELSAGGTEKSREMRGAFFTPAIWADKSKAYLAEVFGPDWQDEYYIWDCAAGTGNLLAGLTNKNNVWASDIDAGNIDTIRALIGGGLNLLHNHVFQFDFLNDILTSEAKNEKNRERAQLKLPLAERKIPPSLCEILDDPEKRRKLIVYINPPYAEATSAKTVRGTGTHKAEVSTRHTVHAEYQGVIGKAANEVFSLFIMRIACEISGAVLAVFSKLKYINAPNFKKFRANFSAEFRRGFIVPAATFDNVSGKFPIGFIIWRLPYSGYGFKFPKTVKLDVYDAQERRIGIKGFYNGLEFINTWISNYAPENSDAVIGVLHYRGTDFQHQRMVFIASSASAALTQMAITEKNIIAVCVYFAARKVIPATWINDRDQFFYPNNLWESDAEFQHDCLVYTLFNHNISCKYGANHWIPFTEKAVGAREPFASNFMSFFLKEKTFSEEARAVLSAGKALWKYYHGKTISANASFYAMKNSNTVSVNASLYDIREFFQGRKENGKMNGKSPDQVYAGLIKALRDALKILAKKIEPKVYEYGFLKE